MKKKITVDGFQCDGCSKETEYAVECRSCEETLRKLNQESLNNKKLEILVSSNK